MKIDKENQNVNMIAFSPSELRARIADRVRQCRLMNKWSQKELCKRAGIHFGTYRVFEKTGQISLARLCQVAIALGRSGELLQLFEPPPVTSLDELPDEPKIRRRGRTL